MKSKNKLLLFILLIVFALALSTYLFCQPAQPTTGGTTDDNEERINFIQDDEAVKTKELLGENTSKALYKITVDTFEGAGEWYAKMPNDQGLIQSRRVLGAPLALQKQGTTDTKVPPKNPPKYRKEDGSYQKEYYLPYKDERKYILGVRVDFQKRGKNWFAIYPYRPIRLKGVVKSFEVWVCGRQKKHELYILVDDAFGNEKIVRMGKLNFLGWKRLTVHVPDRIVQYDYRFSDQRGLTFKGFVVKCDPIESYGKYYVYFDNLAAEVSRFWEEYRDQKDPVDTW